MHKGFFMMPRLSLMLAMTALLALGLAACGGDDDDDGGGAVTVGDPYVRSAGQGVAAAYFTLTGGGEDDRLIGASSDVAATAQVHEVVTEGSSSQMQEVEGIDIPAGGAITFEPGGYHLMLIDLDHALEVGEEVEFTLEFENAGEVTVTADVEDFSERIDGEEDGMDMGDGEEDHDDHDTGEEDGGGEEE